MPAIPSAAIARLCARTVAKTAKGRDDAAAAKAAAKAHAAAARQAATDAERAEKLAGLPPAAALRTLIATSKDFPRRNYDRHYRPDPLPPSGWLLPTLLGTDDLLYRRWDYWTRTRLAGHVLDEPIPPIYFADSGAPTIHGPGFTDGLGASPARKMLEVALDSIPDHGAWKTWGSATYMNYLLDWLLYGFGDLKEPPREPSTNSFGRLYQTFCLEAMLAWPYDYFGYFLSEASFGRSAGFFPTPHNVCEMMVRMQMGIDENFKARLSETVCDPCVGTGRMLLHASNHSLRLYGTDIMHTCVSATRVNLWLYAPWGARPFGFFDRPDGAV